MPLFPNNHADNNAANYTYLSLVLPILALIAPIVLFPLEKVLPYPHILEELTKAFLVFLILAIPGKFFQIKLAVFIGFFFAFSENFFYLSSFIETENLTSFIQRFFLTGFFHILTMLIILISAQKYRYLIFPALLLAMLLHYTYNQNIPLLFH